MRHLLRFATVGVLVLAGWAAPPRLAQAANLDEMADRVLGQPDFSQYTINNGGLGANSLNAPGGVIVDANSGRLFAADTNNHRILSWPNAPALANGQAADLVFGQPDFLSDSSNNGGLSAKSLRFPNRVALDSQGNLYVADYGNYRVLEYDAPLSSGMAASRVFGQEGSFTTAVANVGGLSADSLNGPAGVALDAQGNLYVADYGNNRVLEYDTPLSASTTADRVFGQPDFNSNAPNNSGVNANGVASPGGVAVDAQSNLFVSDTNNNRVLEYDAPLTTNDTADHVFGQPDFTSHSPNSGALGAASLSGPQGVALDGWGNLYVADYANNRVLECDPL